MGKIFLNRLNLCTIIGTLEHERLHPQQLLLDVEIELDMTRAAKSDELCDALDYSALEQEIAATVENSSFKLLEALLGAVGSLIIAHPEVRHCKVNITKKKASRYGQAVAVEAEFDSRGMIR